MHISLFYKFALFLGFYSHIAFTQDYTCGPDRPCELGCCSNGGICGLGPTFCGAGNCTSSCDAKSDCDPGWGSQWSSREKCPLNVCCSQFGFCGTTSDFCGKTTVKKPSCSGKSSAKRTIGYYEGWSLDRKCDTMTPEAIAIGAYTHLNFAFAFIDPKTFKVAPMAENQIPLYKRVTALKKSNPGMEVWISVGGWSMNDPDQPTATTFSDLAGSTANQDLFFRSLISFMETYGFDGIDMDWEYPVAEERSGKPADYDNYTTFLANLKRALGSSGHNYGLTITIPSSYWYMQHFDLVGIAKSIDWFNIMSYDLHGTWDASSKWVGAVLGSHTNLTEIDNALDLLWRNDINPDQVVLGLGLYGRSFTLSNPSCTTPGCPFSSGGKAGACTGNAGTLSYAEILRFIDGGATVTLNKEAAVKQAIWDNDQWVSYDDAETLGMKIDYANKLCLGGTMVWAVSQDTLDGAGASALSDGTELFPGTQQLSKALDRSPPVLSPEGQCFITRCSKNPGLDCPDDKWAPVQQVNGNKRDVSIGHGCSKGESRTYCCPKNDMPTCIWKGSATLCTAGCDKGDVELTYDTNGCNFNHKTLCCKKTTSDVAVSKCVWKGTAPLCGRDNTCPSDKPIEIARSNTGDNQKPCDFESINSNLKVLCCEDPAPLTGCDWFTKGDQNPPPSPRPYKCSGKCPVGKYLIATDDMCFGGGTRALCCDAPATYNDNALTDFKNKLNAFESPLSCPSSQINPVKRDLEGATQHQHQHQPRHQHQHQHQHRHQPETETAPTAEIGKENDLSNVTQGMVMERDFKKAGGFDFISTLLIALRATTYVANLQRQAYNEYIGSLINLDSTTLLKYISWGSDTEDDGFDESRTVLSALCQGRQAAATLEDMRNNAADLCVFRGPDLSNLFKRVFSAEQNVTELERRIFDLGNGLTNPPTVNFPNPYTGSFMRAIANRDPNVRYLYSRLIDYNFAWRHRNANGRTIVTPVPQQILEVAYDIGNAPHLQERVGTDIFGVLHFHIDGTTNDGDALAVRSIGLFHGQYITQMNPQTQDRRIHGYRTRVDVNGRAGANTRTHILRCDDPEDPDDHIDGYYFAPGNAFDVTVGAGSEMIWAMGDEMHTQGILIPGAVNVNPDGSIQQGGHPGSGRESRNFGTRNTIAVDLFAAGYPVVPPGI